MALPKAVSWVQEVAFQVDSSLLLYAVAVVSVTSGLLFLNDVYKHRRARGPLGMKRGGGNKVEEGLRRSVVDAVKHPLERRLVYAKRGKQIPADVDYIVIGSGVGGLTTAAALSRCGYTVLVLEAHDKIGGGCHTFSTKFDWEIGFHYVGEVDKLKEILSVLGSTDFPVEWLPLGCAKDGFAYDRYVFGSGDERVEFVNRKDKRWEDLKKRFPDAKDVAAIDAFQTYGKHALATVNLSLLGRYLPDFMVSLLFRFAAWKWSDVWNRDTASVLKEVFSHNPLLALHVSGLFGCTGGLQRDTAFAGLFYLLNYFDGGAFFPKGGPRAILRALVAAVDECGGNALVSARVKEIVLSEDGRRAVGVTAECSGRRTLEIRCNRGVISAAGFVNTFTRLLPLSKVASACKQVPHKWQQTVARILKSPQTAHSTQHFQVFLGFDKATDELQLPSHNTWFLLCEGKPNNWDYDSFMAEFLRDPLNAPLFVFVSFPSAKSPHSQLAACTMFTEVPFERFEEWKHKQVQARGEDYEELKRKIADRMVQRVFDEWPQLRECVAEMEMGSPLSASHYLNAPKGASYGLKTSCERYYDADVVKALRVNQPIEGLWLTAQDTTVLGVSGAMDGALLCASSILGYHKAACVASGRNLIRDLKRLHSH